MKEKATKMNKRSLQILQQRQERLEKEKQMKETLGRKKSIDNSKETSGPVLA